MHTAEPVITEPSQNCLLEGHKETVSGCNGRDQENEDCSEIAEF
jgi:hypothetical protein